MNLLKAFEVVFCSTEGPSSVGTIATEEMAVKKMAVEMTAVEMTAAEMTAVEMIAELEIGARQAQSSCLFCSSQHPLAAWSNPASHCRISAQSGDCE